MKVGGARSALLGALTGSLGAGKAADVLMLDLSTDAFMPLNDPVTRHVFAGNGASPVIARRCRSQPLFRRPLGRAAAKHPVRSG
jgi:cytosine/adenosine deaminase-related metal-dependent hydrolase